MKKIATKIALLLLATSFISTAIAAEQSTIDNSLSTTITDRLKAALQKIMLGRKVDNIEASAIPGIYSVSYGTDIFYLSEDGKYLIQGDIYDLSSKTNLTEIKRSSGRRAIIDAIDQNTMIIFKPEKTRHIVTVFTDIDCGYCRKLHNEIDTYMEKGIEIRYLAFPRSGINTRSYFKAITAWCAADPRTALTLAKTGAKIKDETCTHPIDQHMAAAEQLSITGTPTLIFKDGSIAPGYLPADRLVKLLDNL